MAAKRNITTRWQATTWDRTYRGVGIWVELMHSVAPKWAWTVMDGLEGRARTKAAAMKAAQTAVDAALNKRADRGEK